ncbi:hypothetical protein GA829_34755 (plasmid) [Mesorhizobium sp. INR15]|nr:hypothetical protein GA829_34755 [Mesorhizobium sp. INR15]
MPHDDVRVGCLNVVNEVRKSCPQPKQRGHRNRRPGGDITSFRFRSRWGDRLLRTYLYEGGQRASGTGKKLHLHPYVC